MCNAEELGGGSTIRHAIVAWLCAISMSLSARFGGIQLLTPAAFLSLREGGWPLPASKTIRQPQLAALFRAVQEYCSFRVAIIVFLLPCPRPRPLTLVAAASVLHPIQLTQQPDTHYRAPPARPPPLKGGTATTMSLRCFVALPSNLVVLVVKAIA